MTRRPARYLSAAVALAMVCSIFSVVLRPKPAAADPPLPSVSDPYAQSVLADNPIAYYRLDEDPGPPSAIDATGNGNTATYGNFVSLLTPGALAGVTDRSAADLESGEPLLTATASSIPTGSAPRTIEFWFRGTSTATEPLLTSSGLVLTAHGANDVQLNDASGNPVDLPTPGSYLDGAWHLFDVAYDGSNVFVSMDGEHMGSLAIGALPATGTVLALGGLVGFYDEVAVYGTALSGDDIAAHWTLGEAYNEACATPPNSSYAQAVLADHPSVYYRLGELNGPNPLRVAYDDSGNCHNGTFTSAASADAAGAPAGDTDGAVAQAAGTSPVMTVNADALPSGTSPRTLEFWEKATDTDNRFTGVLTYDGLQIELAPSDVGAEFSNSGIGVPAPAGDGSWHLIDVTVDGPEGAQVFFDGSLIDSPGALVANSVTSGQTLSLGGLPGSFDELAVYPSELSAAQVSAHWAAAQKLSTAVALGSDSGSVFPPTQAVTFTATVQDLESQLGTPTGTVTFLDGGTPIATVPLDGSAEASTTLSTLSPGPHSVTASYSGDALDAASTSLSLIQNVASSGDTITATPTVAVHSAFGAALTMSTTVTRVGTGEPTGTVTFLDGTTAIGSAPLLSGAATIATSTLPIGPHEITASYSGDTQWQPSASLSTTTTVDPAPVTTTLATSLNPAAPNQTFTLTAHVSSDSGPPTGSVEFRYSESGCTPAFECSFELGSASLDGSGNATLSTSFNDNDAVRQITAVYTGSSTYGQGASAALRQVVQAPDPTTITITSVSPNPVSSNNLAMVTAQVASPDSGDFSAENALLCISDPAIPNPFDFFEPGDCARIGADGSLSIAYPGPFEGWGNPGAHQLVALYTGNDQFREGTSAPYDVQVVPTVGSAPTTVTFASSVNPSYSGQPTTLNVNVASGNGGAQPTGTLTVTDGSTFSQTLTLDASGNAALTHAFFAGSHPLSVSYGGDATYAANSSSLTQTVNQVATSVALTSNANPQTVGHSVTLTATVTPSPSGFVTPTGAVTFTDDLSGPLGTVALDGNGVATLTESGFSLGTHHITAQYGGDTESESSTSSPLAQVVTNSFTTTVAVTSDLDPSVYGQPVTLHATVTPAVGSSGTPTGFVTFLDGSSSLGTAAVNGSGVASLTTSALGAGVHANVSAQYGGDLTFTGASSPPFAQTVNPGATTVAVNAPAGVTGQSVAVTVTVTPTAPAAGEPTGTVTVFDGSAELATGSLDSGGVSTITTSALTGGHHALTATYAGDANFTASTSAPFDEFVAKATSAAVSTSLTPSAVGVSVTFSATVADGSGEGGTPTGTVTFLDGNTSIGTATLDASGEGTLTTASLAAGDHTITVHYGGDAAFAGSDSAPVDQTVEQGATASALSANPATSAYGTAIQLTATVSPVAPALGAPTGTVVFDDGSTVLGSGTLAAGIATLTVVGPLATGTHNITATYAGTANFTTSTSAPAIETVTQATPTVTLSASSSPVLQGHPLTFTVTVAPPGSGTATGMVTIEDGTSAIATLALDGSGHASITTSSLSAGTHSLAAIYGGDANLIPANSRTLILTVNPGIPTATTITSSANPSTFGQSVTFTAHVGASSSTTPTGMLSFFVDGSSVGTASLDGSGHATLTTNGLGAGVHQIAAAYGGDTTFASSTSAALAQTVNASQALVFVTGAHSSAAGSTSGVITVGLDDVTQLGDTPTDAPAGGLDIQLRAGSVAGSFLDASGTTAITHVVMSAGAGTASFTYTGTLAGSQSMYALPSSGSGVGAALQYETVTPGPLDHLVLGPQPTVTIAPGGETPPFVAQGRDAYDNSLGDVTSTTTFAISPDGSCLGSACTATVVGTHIVTATDATATGTATVIVDHPPVPTLTVDNASGVAPQTVTFHVSATDADVGDALSYTLDFGDGSAIAGPASLANGGAPISVTHTYSHACHGCVAVLAVGDGKVSPQPTAVVPMSIDAPAPLDAEPGDTKSVRAGDTVTFDGTNSAPADAITNYHWAFGDGASADGASVTHAYSTAGDRTATLTVAGEGQTSAAAVLVHVTPANGAGLTVQVTTGGSGLAGASVVVEDAFNVVHTGTDLGGGFYRVAGLSDGTYTAYAAASGYLPATVTSTVTNGSGSASVDLSPGQLATTTLTAAPITPVQAQQAGIDLNAPGNNNIYQFTVDLSFDNVSYSIPGIENSNGFIDTTPQQQNGPPAQQQGTPTDPAPRLVIDGPDFQIIGQPAGQYILWMVIPGQAKWLKQLWDVKLMVTNLASPAFTFEHGTGTLNLPPGLSLADTVGAAQQLDQPMPDIPGGSSESAEWIVRGDIEGSYNLTADYSAVLEPTGLPVNLTAATDSDSPLVVYGLSAVQVSLDVDAHAYKTIPYHIGVKVTNNSPVDLYNLSVSLQSPPEDPSRGYLFQPRQQFTIGFGDVAPGAFDETPYPDTPNVPETAPGFIVVPAFTAPLNIAESSVVTAGGASESPSPAITTHDGPDPTLPDPSPDPSHPGIPIIDATVASDGVHVTWQSIPGALAYEAYTSPGYAADFSALPLAWENDGPQFDPATSTWSGVLPLNNHGGYGLVAISTVMQAADGSQFNELLHPIFSLQQTGPVPTSACVAFGQNPDGNTTGNYTTTGADVHVAVTGPPLGITRTYNSLDQSTNTLFGNGWTSDYDMKAVTASDGSVTILQPDGRCATYTPDPNDLSVLQSPSGDYGAVAADGHGGYTLTEKDRTAYTFDSLGRLTAITDVHGRSQALTYELASGPPTDPLLYEVQTVTDVASGRALHFTWTSFGTGDAAVPRVTSIATDPVTAGSTMAPLTWTYGYNSAGAALPGTQLTSVCDARGPAFCTDYTYAGAGTGTTDQLTAIIPPAGTARTNLTYNCDGRMKTETDGQGNQTHFDYADGPPLDGSPSPEQCDMTVTPALAAGFHRTIETDALGNQTTTDANSGYQVFSVTSPSGGLSNCCVTSYTYDANGFRNSTTDPNGNTTRMTWDSHGNLLSQTNGAGQTSYNTYDGDDFLIASRDGRSASATDATYATIYQYSTTGELLSQTLPATADQPLGSVTRYAYSDSAPTGSGAPANARTGTDPAFTGGGVVPPGLKHTITNAQGGVTTDQYDSAGDLVETVNPSGLRTDYTYDQLGRKLSETVHDSAFTSPITTTWTYDALGHVQNQTDPVVANRVTGHTHQLRITNTYDANGNLTTIRYDDLSGGDASRTVKIAYDHDDRATSVTDALNGVTSQTYDADGRIATKTDADGRTTETTYDSRGLPITVTLEHFVQDPIAHSSPRNLVEARMTYDAGGRKITQTNALGRTTRYTYDAADRVLSATLESYQPVTGAPRAVVLSSVSAYDGDNNPISRTQGDSAHGSRTTAYTYDQQDHLVTTTLESGLDRCVTSHYDGVGDVTDENVSDGSRTEEVTSAYDNARHLKARTIVNGLAPLVTTYGYDQRGDVTSVTDPKGDVTTNTYDSDGRRTSTVAPAVSLNATITTVHPATTTGYDTFGNPTQVKDPNGHVTTTAYDKLNRVSTVTLPTYVTPAGGSVTSKESMTYDSVGNRIKLTDRRGQTTTFTYDALNRVVQQVDPKVTGHTAAGVARTTYDDAGNVLSTTDENGAKTSYGYDDLNRVRTKTEIVRQTGTSPRWSYDYDDLGDQTVATDPNGDTTHMHYNAASELTSSTDPSGATTMYQRDLAGRVTSVTDPLGRSTVSTFDPAGRLTAVTHLGHTGATLDTTTYGYDRNGNQTTAEDARGTTTTYTFDALNRLTRVSQPSTASHAMVTTYGYDADGNTTKMIDGDGHATTFTYNSWDLPQSVVEPATTAFPAVSNRTWTNTYDTGGLLTKTAEPGGVTTTRAYDQLGRMTQRSGSGGGATAATYTYGYDLVGNLTSVSAPAGTVSAKYDDRGLPTSVSGPQGTTSTTYDASGRPTRQVDGIGTESYTWNSRSLLATEVDPLTKAATTNTYDADSELTKSTYGATLTRSYAYDDRARMTSDTLVRGTGTGATTLTALSYGYDPNGNLTSRRITANGNSLSGTETATYDLANRITSWVAPSIPKRTYSWDDAGNLTHDGTTALTYDQRNRLLKDGTLAYTWTARGTPATIGSTPQSYNALDQLIKVGQTTYAYDGLGRLATRDGKGFQYDGLTSNLTTDGTSKYTWTPTGLVLSSQQGTAAPTVVGQNTHGDVTWQVAQKTGVVASDAIRDPFGALLGHQGMQGSIGFQGNYVDPTTAAVQMGARWYSPTTGSFANRDSFAGETADPITEDRYTYADGDPLTLTDPTGFAAEQPGSSSGDIGTTANPSLQTTVYQAGSSQVSYMVSNLTHLSADVTQAIAASETQGLSTNSTQDPSHQGWADDGSFLAGFNQTLNFVAGLPSAILDNLRALAGQVWNGLAALPGKLVQTYNNLTSGQACAAWQSGCGNEALTPQQAVAAVGTVLQVAAVVLPVVDVAGAAIETGIDAIGAVSARLAANTLELVDDAGGAIAATAENVADEVATAASEAADEIGSSTEDAFDSVERAAGDAEDSVEEAARSAEGTMKEFEDTQKGGSKDTGWQKCAGGAIGGAAGALPGAFHSPRGAVVGTTTSVVAGCVASLVPAKTLLAKYIVGTASGVLGGAASGALTSWSCGGNFLQAGGSAIEGAIGGGISGGLGVPIAAGELRALSPLAVGTTTLANGVTGWVGTKAPQLFGQRDACEEKPAL